LDVPLWLKLAYGTAVSIIAVDYWRKYGPSNFLWLSDIALACTAVSVLTGIACSPAWRPSVSWRSNSPGRSTSWPKAD
jgi:hypothetical protein